MKWVMAAFHRRRENFPFRGVSAEPCMENLNRPGHEVAVNVYKGWRLGSVRSRDPAGRAEAAGPSHWRISISTAGVQIMWKTSRYLQGLAIELFKEPRAVYRPPKIRRCRLRQPK